jgi:hypothetical protein
MREKFSYHKVPPTQTGRRLPLTLLVKNAIVRAVSRLFATGAPLKNLFTLALTALAATTHANAANPRDLTFSRACEPGEQITLAAVGDVLLHGQLQAQAARSGHQSLWREALPLLQSADLAYANLEGPTAEGLTRGGRYRPNASVWDNNAYTGYPTFNYHPSLNQALVNAGFDFVSTANNHSLDRGGLGVDKTIESLQRVNLPFAGTRTRSESSAGTSTTWHAITEKNGFRLAWIACTFSTNGIADPKRQVLGCFKNADLIEKAIRDLSANPKVDAVILTPHWGEVEYTQRIEPSQAKLARRFLEAGATAIFGNHPHVTKPWEKIATRDGRETFVIYSIGNFVSAQSSLAKQTSAVILLGLTKGADGKAFVNGVRYVPLFMRRGPFTLAVGEKAPAPAHGLLAKLLGGARKMGARESLVTNLECGN